MRDGVEGPAEDSHRRLVVVASETGDGFVLPADSAVIAVTITPVG